MKMQPILWCRYTGTLHLPTCPNCNESFQSPPAFLHRFRALALFFSLARPFVHSTAVSSSLSLSLSNNLGSPRRPSGRNPVAVRMFFGTMSNDRQKRCPYTPGLTREASKGNEDMNKPSGVPVRGLNDIAMLKYLERFCLPNGGSSRLAPCIGASRPPAATDKRRRDSLLWRLEGLASSMTLALRADGRRDGLVFDGDSVVFGDFISGRLVGLVSSLRAGDNAVDRRARDFDGDRKLEGPLPDMLVSGTAVRTYYLRAWRCSLTRL